MASWHIQADISRVITLTFNYTCPKSAANITFCFNMNKWWVSILCYWFELWMFELNSTDIGCCLNKEFCQQKYFNNRVSLFVKKKLMPSWIIRSTAYPFLKYMSKWLKGNSDFEYPVSKYTTKMPVCLKCIEKKASSHT